MVLDVKFLHNAFYHWLLLLVNSAHEIKVVFVNIAILTFRSVVTILHFCLRSPFYFEELLHKLFVPLGAIKLRKLLA